MTQITKKKCTTLAKIKSTHMLSVDTIHNKEEVFLTN